MPPRKSDQGRKSDATPASSARFAPIDGASPALVPMQTPGPALVPAASPALALPTMDTSMPPPSLPPPSATQTPDAASASFQQQAPTGRPGSGSASHATPSEKGKDREEGAKSGPGGHPKEAVTIPIEVRVPEDQCDERYLWC